MRHTTKLYLIIAGLVALIFIRECKHAQRQEYFYKQMASLEYEIDDIKADYYNDGFNACLEQF
jgi:hypothetical protein